MSNEFTVSVENGIGWVARSTAVLGVAILLLTLIYLGKPGLIAKEVFEDVVVNTWLPIFNTLIVAVLGWVFGKPLVNSLAQRIKKP
jgi:hypothetical protein